MKKFLHRWCLVLTYLNFHLVHTTEINESNLRSLLTDAEWENILGLSNLDYTLAYPKFHRRSKRSLKNEKEEEKEKITDRVADDEHHLTINTTGRGKEFELILRPSPELLAPEFVLLETYSNESYILPHHPEDTKCYYRSENAALSICGGIRGIVRSDKDEYFVIHPLPKRFHTDDSSPHVLVRKQSENLNRNSILEKDYNNKSSNDTNSNTSKESNQWTKYRRKLKKAHRSDNGDIVYNTTMFLKNDNYPELPKESNVTVHLKSLRRQMFNRRKRETLVSSPPPGSPVFVETAVFVDKDLFNHMKTNFPTDTERELIRFVLAMINAVQLLYHDPSLGRPVNFLLKRLEILREEATGLSRPPDIDRFLSSFCNWQRERNPVGDREPQHWDHAVILTGLDLYVRGKHGKISSQVVGLAPVAGMCTATSSCTVNEGRHFESVYVVAHEIGHNLGMRHDGPSAENDCDPSSYIMSPTLGSGKITWSACSRRYLQTFLETPQSRCLLDHGSSAGQLDHSAEGALPGERFDADQQCMLKYGRGSMHSVQQPLDDICRDLHCQRERYTWTSHPALEGTSCGHNLWCRGGRCSVRGIINAAAFSSPAVSSKLRVEGGWSNWRPFSDCASGCLFGEDGRLRGGSTGIMVATRNCNKPRPQGSGGHCDGPDKRYQACTSTQCLNVPRLTVREFSEQICSRAREVDSDLTGKGMQRIMQNPEEACMVWCQKRNGGTKSRGWTFPDGTVCQTGRSKYKSRSEYCINGRCEQFKCDHYDEDTPFAQLPDLCPVDRDDNEILWRPGLRRRESGVHWGSASGCHYNCINPGTGIRLVISKGKHGRSSLQICQPDGKACGRLKSPFQHASAVCSKYKERVRRLSGLGMQISAAAEDPDRPCKVACQDENVSHRFYLVNGEEGWFPFGTDCSRGNSDKKLYCISGKCLEFGADDTPVSESEFTLPLLQRSRRSLQTNKTKVIATLQQKELDEIISKLNLTTASIIDTRHTDISDKFEIDLSNPIHVDMETSMSENKGHRTNY